MAEPDRGATPTGDAPADAAKADEKKGLGSALYKLALAGVGAVVMAQEELETAWKKARPGDKPEKADRPEKTDKPTERPEKADKPEKAEAGWAAHIDGAISKVLRSLSIPTRAEVEELSRRIDALAKAVDERAARR